MSLLGKTTCLARVSAFLMERGFNVFTVPEAATMLFTNGATQFDDSTTEVQVNNLTDAHYVIYYWLVFSVVHTVLKRFESRNAIHGDMIYPRWLIQRYLPISSFNTFDREQISKSF